MLFFHNFSRNNIYKTVFPVLLQDFRIKGDSCVGHGAMLFRKVYRRYVCSYFLHQGHRPDDGGSTYL
jgi:hypothetical protein